MQKPVIFGMEQWAMIHARVKAGLERAKQEQIAGKVRGRRLKAIERLPGIQCHGSGHQGPSGGWRWHADDCSTARRRQRHSAAGEAETSRVAVIRQLQVPTAVGALLVTQKPEKHSMADAATLTQQLISTLRRYEAAWLAYKLDDPMRAQLRTEARQLRQRAYAEGGLALVQRVGEQAIAAGIFLLTIDGV